MTNEEWNNVQDNLFSKLFLPVEDGVSAKKIIQSLEGRKSIWQSLYKMVGKDIEPNNERFSIMDLGRIEYQGRMYLVLRHGLWEFVVIDLENMCCIDQEDGINMAQDDVFEQFRGIDKQDIELFGFDKLKKKTIKKVVDYYVEHQDIFEGPRKIYYSFQDEDRVTCAFTINFGKSDVMVSVNDFKSGRCNYIFLNSNLEVYGASNLTGNKDSIGRLFDGSRDIMIPRELVGPIQKDMEEMENKNGNSFSINKQV